MDNTPDKNEIVPDNVPYIVHEAETSRLERVIQRFWILAIILVVLLVGTNAAWIVYENQFVDEMTVTQENESGFNSYVGNDGDIFNGDVKYGEADSN